LLLGSFEFTTRNHRIQSDAERQQKDVMSGWAGVSTEANHPMLNAITAVSRPSENLNILFQPPIKNKFNVA
jgi:hypothetical protein